MEPVVNFQDRRILLIALFSLISGLTSEIGRPQTLAPPDPAPGRPQTIAPPDRTQSIAPPDPAPVAGSPSPVPANPFESEITSLQAKLSQSPIASSPVVFYGSSSIRLWKSLQQDFSGYAVMNCGFGGSRLTDCVRYANRIVLPLKPSAIVIYAGDNDLAVGTPPEKVFKSFQQLFSIFRGYSPSIPIAFVSVKPSPARLMFLDNILKFNRLVEDFLKTQPETEYIDVCSDMLGQDRKPIRSLFVNDQIHLSPAGYQIMRREIGEFLSQECPRRPAGTSQINSNVTGSRDRNSVSY
jgi:lysophospholipase L1-like esterase